MIKIEWKDKTGKYSTGFGAYVGTIQVGGTHWGTSKQAGGPWVASIILPGISIKEQFRNQMTEADARKIVEMAVRKWFQNCGVKVDQ